MTRTETIAAFVGATCHGLLAQECYYQGELAEAANLLFFATAPDRWLRFFIDCGSFGLSEAPTVEAIPPETTDPEFRYPLVDLAARYPVVGRRVTDAVLVSQPHAWADAAEFRLTFDDGAQLALVNRDDASTVEYRPPAG